MTTTTEQAAAAIYPIVAEILCVDPSWITPDRFLADAPNADSLDIVELQLAIEDSLDLRIEDEELADVSTIRELTEVVRAKLAERNA